MSDIEALKLQVENLKLEIQLLKQQPRTQYVPYYYPTWPYQHHQPYWGALNAQSAQHTTTTSNSILGVSK